MPARIRRVSETRLAEQTDSGFAQLGGMCAFGARSRFILGGLARKLDRLFDSKSILCRISCCVLELDEVLQEDVTVGEQRFIGCSAEVEFSSLALGVFLCTARNGIVPTLFSAQSHKHEEGSGSSICVSQDIIKSRIYFGTFHFLTSLTVEPSTAMPAIALVHGKHWDSLHCHD